MRASLCLRWLLGMLPLLDFPVSQAAMVWSKAYPQQAIRYAALVDSKNVPILFYGLCLDQDGNPLEGVRLKLGVRQWRGVSRLDLQGVELAFDRISDKSGRFELTGINGDVAGVDGAQKEGYTWMKKGSASVDFWGRRTFVPTLDSPFILHFWKKLGAEPLYVTQPFNFQGVRCNGEPVTYDLITGAKTPQSANPSVRFAMQRAPETLTRQNKAKYDWLYTIEIPGGGVLETTTNMPFVAPAEGYLPRASIGFQADDPAWKAEAQRVLFFKTSTGSYGRLEVRLLADDEGNEASFKWTSYLNPSGSPVLEYDPAKQLKAPASTPASAFQGAAPQPPATAPPQPSVPKGPAPFIPQPPSGFQLLTNRGQPFPPGVPPRPPP